MCIRDRSPSRLSKPPSLSPRPPGWETPNHLPQTGHHACSAGCPDARATPSTGLGHHQELVSERPDTGNNLSLIHISEPTRRTPISYAVFCLKKHKKDKDVPI